MHDNHVYNILNQLVQEHKSLWRINNGYTKDAGDCADCKTLWKEIAKTKEDHVEKLTEILKSHLS